MPQFDAYSFSGQVFWTLFGFCNFYFFVLSVYVVLFSEMFKMRKKFEIWNLMSKKFSSIVDISSSTFHIDFKF
jgi:hypothetical protein